MQLRITHGSIAFVRPVPFFEATYWGRRYGTIAFMWLLACLQVVFGALPQSEREEILRLGTAQMPLAPDLDLNAMSESMR